MSIECIDHVIIDSLPRISLKYLRVNGLFLFSPVKVKTKGMTVWAELIDDDPDDARIELTWTVKDQQYAQYIPLMQTETNLGPDFFRWYFTDNERKIKYIKAYFNGKLFVPRSYFKKAYYESQVDSKRAREFENTYLRPIKILHRLLTIISRPYLKLHYQGRPTKVMLRIKRLQRKVF